MDLGRISKSGIIKNWYNNGGASRNI